MWRLFKQCFEVELNVNPGVKLLYKALLNHWLAVFDQFAGLIRGPVRVGDPVGSTRQHE
mgnify:CR=1 FL=1